MKKLVLLVLLIASSASADIYTWKDGKGTVYYTNSLHEIPARYRSRAKLLDVASGKKMPIPAGVGQQATAQGAAQAPAPAPGAALPAATNAPAQAAAGQPGSVQQPRSQQAPAEQRPGFTIVPQNPAPAPVARPAEQPARVPAPQRRVRTRPLHEGEE